MDTNNVIEHISIVGIYAVRIQSTLFNIYV